MVRLECESESQGTAEPEPWSKHGVGSRQLVTRERSKGFSRYIRMRLQDEAPALNDDDTGFVGTYEGEFWRENEKRTSEVSNRGCKPSGT